MFRFLVIFRSHHDALADVHFVDTEASSPLAAIAKATREQPPMRDWVIVHALVWPRGCSDVNQAAKRYASRR